MKDGVNLFKKEDQKYNLISYTNEEELTLKEVLLDKLNFSVRSISKMKREQSVFVNGVFKKPSLKNAAFALKPSAICIGGSLPR